MSTCISSLSLDQAIDALASFAELFMGGAKAVRAQVNRVSMPSGDCAVLTEIMQVDLSVPYAAATSASAVTLAGPKRLDIQIDFYGASAAEWCNAFMTAFRTGYGFDQFIGGIRPLYCSDGVQAPLVSGEQQYVSRWTVTASLQYNATVSIPQQTASVVAVSQTIPADLTD